MGANLYLYHMVIYEKNDDKYKSPQIVLKEGLNHKTATKWYSNSSKLFPELTERFRPSHLPEWVDFDVAFRADLEAFEKPCYRFPMFSEKILVFNHDLSSDLFAYIEDLSDGGRGRFVEGLPTKEDLMKLYWASRNTLDEYLKNKPYNNPEVYIFEPVPAKLIDYLE